MKGFAPSPVSISEPMNHSYLSRFPITNHSASRLGLTLTSLLAILATASPATATVAVTAVSTATSVPPRSAPARENNPRLIAALSKPKPNGATPSGSTSGNPFSTAPVGSGGLPGVVIPDATAEPLEQDLDSLLAVPCGAVSLFGDGLRPSLAAELLGCNPDASGGAVNLYGGNALPNAMLAGDTGIGSGGLLLYTTSDHVETVRIIGAEHGTQGAQALFKNAEGNKTIEIDAQDSTDPAAGGAIRMRKNDGSTTVELKSEDADGQGLVALYTNDGATETVRLVGSEYGTQGSQLLLKNKAGNTTVEIDSQEGSPDTAGALVRLKNNNGDVTIKLQSDANGEGVITTQVLTITGGSDLSERFDVRPSNDPDATPRPGMLVSIDPSRPGELRVADRPCDTTVAGIISGAGGIKTGMLMGQSGTLADGTHPVALSGRVYCYADASFGAIRPGDLLTTSSKAGHAMRTTATEAAGAVIGKAMTSLESGQGLVLVLVNLQ